MENNTDWEIVGDYQAPPIFQVEGTTIDARTSSIEVRGWNTMDLVSFGNYMVSKEREMLIDTHPELTTSEDKEEAYHQVSDADLHNWASRFRHQNDVTFEGVPSTDDAPAPDDGADMGKTTEGV